MVALRTLTVVLCLTLATEQKAGAAHELKGREIALSATLYAERCAACHGCKRAQAHRIGDISALLVRKIDSRDLRIIEGAALIQP